ncbi:HNH endonuclease [Sporosarcina sp. HYO08]|uniref:HNH endonuclease n=1 Tax=Sporosarcina sp. HYO08 TaxID=1759557 RepID=UPI00079A0A42|nr:HNH endonuclease [Sporosarcina sp. HYO08]KXH87374.1 hypothetical protein AU377_02030 [Sporosarcina sp. HYO08]
MFVRNIGVVTFEAQNENHGKLMKYFYRKNGWHGLRKFNSFKDNGDGTVTLFLIRGYETIISAECLPLVLETSKVSISIKMSGIYATTRIKEKTTDLHRLFMREELAKYEGFEKETGMSIQVNHRNENPLDNRLSNLEVVTDRENYLKYQLNHAKGYYKTPSGKFEVKFRNKNVGTFETEAEARKAYVHAVKKEIKRLEEIRMNWLKSNGHL